ncbi:GntR family transcriptional regulator [Jeotgalibacillus campisalis]|uniref:HTH gntR-type domain-containing protein n=1 Tax=Jeotgalibacillus campisalis TaxID=220754 RepID=A0A0C2R6P3_9BACL|nr:GntR family transcriptional regulator [Jeotgalibacillus campisalis]KIL45915.1 hypothetical protein KR50_25900 [Jeotgalibacillus campisalis]
MNNPIKKHRAIHEQVHELIKERIIQGDYQPNQRLYEAHLAKELSVSRSPVREAIRILEQEGLINQDKQSRLYVYSPGPVDVEQIYQCREVLESLAASLSADNATKKQLDEILATAVASHDYIMADRNEDKHRLIELNSLFHDLIIRSSQNRRLLKQLDNLRTLTFIYRRMNIHDENRRREIAEQHVRIAEFLVNREGDQASSLMREHIASDKRFLMTILKSQKNSLNE